MRHFIVRVTVFITGGVLMILELVGVRLVAPYIGTSFYVWSSLIGTILLALTVGYWLGGKLADKKPHIESLSLIIFLTAFSIGSISIIAPFILRYAYIGISDIRIKSIISSLIIFGIPSVLIAMVTPYAAKLEVKNLNKTGRSVGNLYAISNAGSIIGTLGAGFFLIPHFNITLILVSISILLFLLSIAIRFRGKALLLMMLIPLQIPLIGSPKWVVLDTNSQYNRILLVKSTEEKTKRPIVYLITDAIGVQSSMYLDRDDTLVMPYTRFFRLIHHFNPRIKRSLMIGGGGYSYPKDYLKRDTRKYLDVVEIDPKLTEIARKYFNLEDNNKLTIYHEDGRPFLNKTRQRYDAIVIDAFHSSSIPFQLTTFEAVNELNRILNKEGVIMVNIISSVYGRTGKFLRAEYATYLKIFPQVYLFAVDDPSNGTKVQNIILVALKSDKIPRFESSQEEFNGYLENRFRGNIPLDMPVLTDNYAPVEYFASELLH